MKHLLNVFLLSTFLLLINCGLVAQPLKQNNKFTHADTLRGTYGASRDWWDVLKYDLYVKFNIADSTISGYNQIQFKVLKPGNTMQIDLQEPMILDSIKCKFSVKKQIEILKINFLKDGDAYFFSLPTKKQGGRLEGFNNITIYYHGKPTVARNPPWDGGVIYKKDKNKNPWVSIACQGKGSSVWYPCKDHQADEPDSAEMHITIPDSLVCVGNGKLRNKITNKDGTATFDWAVTSPINSYCLIPYIGKYVHFSELYKGEKGNLEMDYWVLDYNKEKALKHFADAPKMMKAFEYWFGPYPFYKDGYKLVDAPHLGMEHQSATAYGNGYQNGYLGKDWSGSGWGMKWDFIIIHESGHEWFANNITTKDIADMWVHEGFTNYSETLFTDYWYGKVAGNAYNIGSQKNISNDIPIIGPYGVNKEGSGDMYAKAGSMLHTIRQIINSDEKFRQILRGLNKTFYHQTVTTNQIENYINQKSKINFSKVFDQYLRTTQIPILEYTTSDLTIKYRYTNCINNFNMPLKITFDKERWIYPTTEWQTKEFGSKNTEHIKETKFLVDANFYINTKKVD
jgi:aminopeptidase N